MRILFPEWNEELIGRRVMVTYPDRPFDGYEATITTIGRAGGYDGYPSEETVMLEFGPEIPEVKPNDPIPDVRLVYSPVRFQFIEDEENDE